MSKRSMAAWAVLVLCMTACGTYAPTPTETPGATPPESEAKTFVYAGAVKDFLLPEEDHSWAREHGAEFVMLHFTSAVVSQPEDPYDMKAIRDIFIDSGVSVHYVIDREGTVFCWVPEDRVAWHAGRGTFAGDETYTDRMNHYAIGIEMTAIGSQADMAQYLSAEEYGAIPEERVGYTDAQYEALRALVTDVCARSGIPMDADHVIGHQAYNPEKSDPGELFDWDRLLEP